MLPYVQRIHYHVCLYLCLYLISAFYEYVGEKLSNVKYSKYHLISLVIPITGLMT